MKLKTVTIIHSATTETVRLPDDNNGVIVHTAVRTKVPLKKKVRGERKKKHQQKSMPVSASKENTAVATATNTSSGVSTQKNTPRHKTFYHESPRKLLRQHKKKKQPQHQQQRTSSAENDMKNEEMAQQQQQQQLPRRTKKATKPKEIIDYSNPQQHLNTFGKVQKWLLESPIVASAASQFEHSSKVPTTTIMNKSHSNPEHLSLNGKNQQQQPPQHKLQRSSKPKLKAPGVANNKVRLQVVFKPPFKFALKLSKNENSVKTGEPNAKKNDVRRRSSLDVPQLQPKTKRTALLIRSTADEMDNLNEHLNDYIQEPIYETLNPKTLSNQRKKASTLPTDDTLQNYENLPTTSSTANLMDATLNNSFSTPINTATFRVNKSSSGNNITNRNLPVISPDSLKKSQKHRLSNSSSSLIKLDGSLQNLTRSSTTNLAKKTSSSSSRHDVKRRASDMNRSSTTNLNKYHRQQSHSNLRRGDSNVDVSTCPAPTAAAISSSSSQSPPNTDGVFMVNEKKSSHMRKSSLSNSNVTTSCQQTGSSRRESFKNNIPRASLINSTIANALSSNLFSQRQTSFNAAKPTPLSHQSRLNIDELNKNRPNTSSCDSSMFKNFEWPKVLTTQRSLPAENALQSDLEVFVSDGETLVNDS
jgi:disintegrin and metalloproteinase domain-containing protein 10